MRNLNFGENHTRITSVNFCRFNPDRQINGFSSKYDILSIKTIIYIINSDYLFVCRSRTVGETGRVQGETGRVLGESVRQGGC